MLNRKAKEMVIILELNSIIVFLGCIIFLFIIGKIFIIPLKSILKLVLNSIIGGLIIFVINVVGEMFSFHIGLNALTSILVGLLGIPGAILLIILKLTIGV